MWMVVVVLVMKRKTGCKRYKRAHNKLSREATQKEGEGRTIY